MKYFRVQFSIRALFMLTFVAAFVFWWWMPTEPIKRITGVRSAAEWGEELPKTVNVETIHTLEGLQLHGNSRFDLVVAKTYEEKSSRYNLVLLDGAISDGDQIASRTRLGQWLVFFHREQRSRSVSQRFREWHLVPKHSRAFFLSRAQIHLIDVSAMMIAALLFMLSLVSWRKPPVEKTAR